MSAISRRARRTCENSRRIARHSQVFRVRYLVFPNFKCLGIYFIPSGMTESRKYYDSTMVWSNQRTLVHIGHTYFTCVDQTLFHGPTCDLGCTYWWRRCCLQGDRARTRRDVVDFQSWVRPSWLATFRYIHRHTDICIHISHVYRTACLSHSTRTAFVYMLYGVWGIVHVCVHLSVRVCVGARPARRAPAHAC